MLALAAADADAIALADATGALADGSAMVTELEDAAEDDALTSGDEALGKEVVSPTAVAWE